MPTESNYLTLEERISVIEATDNESADLQGIDWLSIIVFGAIVPGCLLWWGW